MILVKEKFRDAYMKVAETFAELSSAKRLHVGAIVVKEDRIISIGYNGMPSVWIIEWELDYVNPQTKFSELVTRKEVIHAEANAIAKLAKSTESGDGAVMFLTHAPCMDCAKQVYAAGIRKVYFGKQYRSADGIDFLNKCNIEVEQWTYGVNT